MAKKALAGDVAAVISPASFWVPEYICPTAWIEHAPFAFWICEALRPRRFVELGTHYGYSYFAFCQAIDRLGLGTNAYAVDTWKGDEHAGFYDETVFQSVAARNDEKYSAFSCLIRSTFDDAVDYFTDGSVDLLHIDGRHFYDDVKHDFEVWRPKLTEDAVVLFHDTNVRERQFGVWKFFEEIAAEHPAFLFAHGYGLGLLTLGERPPAPLAPIFRASRKAADRIRAAYAALGAALRPRAILGERDRDIENLRLALGERDRDIENLRATVGERDRDVENLRAILGERDGDIENLRTALGQERTRATEEIESQKALVAAAIDERERETAALASAHEAAAALQAELTDRERSLVDAERNAADHMAAAQMARAGLSAAKSQLAATVAELTSLQAELNAREISLRDALRQIAQMTTEAEVVQSESATTRSALAQARNHAAKLALAMETTQADLETSRAECSALRSIATEERAARDAVVTERDAAAAASTRWFEAVVAVTADHNPLAPAADGRHSRWRKVAVHLGGRRRRPSPMALADRARDARKWELAARYYRDALDFAPTRAAIWVQLGHALKEAGKVTEAEVAYRKALDLEPENADTQAQLGHALRLQGKSAEAAAAYRKALAGAPAPALRRGLIEELNGSLVTAPD